MHYPIKPHRNGDGLIVEGVAGEALDNYNLVYIKGGKWYKADRDAELTMPGYGMVLSDLPINYKGRILLYGLVSNRAWAWVDGPIYASSTPGGLTQTAPTTAGYSQAVGVAHGSDYMLLVPMWARAVTRPHIEHVQAGKFGRPNTNPPDVVTVDNSLLLEFDVNTDITHYKWEISDHYVPGTDLTLMFHWTNDGGVDDNTKNIKIQIAYKPVTDGDVISGSHANSPRHIDDAYTSDLGSVFHTTGSITIPAADFAGKHQIEMKFMFVTADVTALTGKPRLDAMMLTYTEYIEL